MKLIRLATLLSVMLGWTSCVSIPQESVELAQLTGEMIQSAKLSHVNMVNLHFDFRRKEVEQFAYGEWKTLFIKNVTSKLEGAGQEMTIEKYDLSMDRVRKIATEWTSQVDADRAKVLQALEEHYTVLTASNEELTSLLRSAADLSQTRTALLDRWGAKVGISSQKIQEVENKLSQGTTRIRDLFQSERNKLTGPQQ